MDLFNGKITRRINNKIREYFILPKLRKNIKKNDWSLICNNCTGGIITHDLGQEFRSPTVNLYFPGMCFFDFIENLEYYLHQEIDESPDEEDVEWPVGIIYGGEEHPDIKVSFMHYKTFEEAKEKWNIRKQRVNRNNIFIMWTFYGEKYAENVYERFEQLPFKNKVAFDNKPSEKFKSIYYIKGFEAEKGIGLISAYKNLAGRRYYDDFNYVKWFNTGQW